MNANQLLQHFERISEAPDAIPRLRRFILELAVRGKLVEQDPSDEPAAELLKRIAAEKARLVKAKEIRRPKESEPIRDDECPISLPRTWAWSRLCDIGKLAGGMTPSMNRSDFWGGDVVWLSPKDIKADEINDSELKISPLGLSETRLELYRPGCLFIVARSGILKRTFPVSINRVAAAANQDMKVLVPFLEGGERYLQIMFRGLTDFLLRDLVKTGTTVQSLKYAEFEQQPFPLPPLAEQHRIVAKVDELMSLCDQLEAAKAEREQCRDSLVAASLQGLNQPAEEEETFREHARFTFNNLPRITTRATHIKQLRQAILNLAVRGKLVEQDPSDEPATELLKRIVSETPQSKSIEARNDQWPYILPECWTWTRFGRLISKSDAGWSPKTENYPRSDENWGVLKVSAVSWDEFRPWENKQVLPGTEPRAQAVVKLADFLISRANTAELIGRAVIVNEEPVKLMMSDKIVRLYLSSKCNPRYLWMVNNYSDSSRTHYARGASGVSPSMKNISRDVILNLPLPLPPLAEQHRIVAKVDELMAICDQLEDQITVTEQDSSRFLESVLADALAPGIDLSAEAQVA